jgi:hypothetical protein
MWLQGGTAMKLTPIGHQPHIQPGRYHATGWFKAFVRRMVALFQQALQRGTDQEPTVEHMVDQIMATGCGESCEVKLNPRISRIDNLKWLLPICVQQFGTAIAISEHAEGDQVVLTILVTERKHTKIGQPAGGEGQDAAAHELPLEVV